MIQLANRPNKKPLGAGDSAKMYEDVGTWHCREGANRHWVHNGLYWRKINTKAVGLHNRIDFGKQQEGRGGFRKASMKAQQGSAASYFPEKIIKKKIGKDIPTLIRSAKAKRGNYAAKMQTVTGYKSATHYAQSLAGIPAVHGGYNWCHLIGHGGGGKDEPDNLVAASTHANSEHLLIERVVYNFKGKVSITHTYEEAIPGEYIAKKMTYKIYVDKKEVYSREVNGFRQDKPSESELKVVEHQVIEKITGAINLVRR